MKKIAMVTYDEEPLLTDDDRLVIEPLKGLGYCVTPVVWDSASSLNDYDAIILRSCWNYHLKNSEFLAWLEEMKTLTPPVLNPIDICMWNISKSYLLELEDKGILIPKTILVKKNDPFWESLGNFKNQVVIKPAVSLNGYDTHLIPSDEKELIRTTVNSLLEKKDVLLQEYVSEIKTSGEISLIFFNGKFSHAIKKLPTEHEFRIHREYGGTRHPFTPDKHLLDQALRIISKVGRKLLSCRVDVILRENKPYLIELEIIDPMLFLGYNEGAPQRFAEAIHECLGGRP